MIKSPALLVGAAAVVAFSSLARPVPSSAASDEPLDIYIRQLAGLPASSAKGDIAILEVGHMPTDRMVSIVATHIRDRWHVSYACAESPACAPGSDHMADDYDLSTAAGQKVEAIVAKFRGGLGPDEPPAQPGMMMCGRLTVAVDYQGFNHTYYRTCGWGEDLEMLERLLQQPHD